MSNMVKVKEGFALYEGVGQIYIPEGVEFQLTQLDDINTKIIGKDGLTFKVNKFMIDKYFELV